MLKEEAKDAIDIQVRCIMKEYENIMEEYGIRSAIQGAVSTGAEPEFRKGGEGMFRVEMCSVTLRKILIIGVYQ